MENLGKGRIKEALNLAGSQHKYQKTMIFLIACIWIEINYLLIGPTFIYIDPMFTCLSTGDREIQQSEACPMINECKLIDNFSITADMKLYCEREWARDTIQSIFSLGAFFGLVILGVISDAKGRKKAIMISFGTIFTALLSSFIGGYFNIVSLAIIGQFLSGFGAYSMISLCYTLFADFFSDKLRSIALVLVSSVWGISTFLLGIFYFIQLHWTYFLIFAIFLPLLILSIIFYGFIVQSPYILFNQNNIEEAIFSLATVATINNKKEEISEIRKIVYSQKKRTQDNKANFQNIWKIMKKWEYFKPILVITIIMGFATLNFFGFSYSFDSQGYGYGYNSIIAGCVEMISFIYLNFNQALEQQSQSEEMELPYFMESRCLQHQLYLSQKFVRIDQQPQQYWQQLESSEVTLFQLLKAVGYTLIACLQVESFTVEIQSTAVGVIQAFSLFGALLAPLTVDLADKIGVDAIAFNAILLLLSIGPNFFLKETLVPNQKINPLLESDQKEQIEQQSEKVQNPTLLSQDS